jgi:signal transduction histidine kinase
VAQVRNIRPGYVVIHPNRDKASCKLVRLIVCLILLLSAVMMLAITVGGSSKLAGLKPVNVIWILIYIILAVYIWLRWARGLLPIAAMMAVLLLMVAVVSSVGLAGTNWFNRSHQGFAAAQSLFGGSGLSDSVLGTLTVLLIAVELALIAFAMIGFAQGWNVEMEVPEEEARKRGSKPVARGDSEDSQGSKGSKGSKGAEAAPA